MRLEDQVIGLDQAKRLKELGITQSSLFYHIFNTIPEVGYEGCKMRANPIDAGVVRYYSAFTVAELGIMLPDLICYNNLQYELVIIKEAPETWLLQYSRNNNLLDTLQHIDRVYGKTMAEGAAYMLIHLIEIEKITTEEVNHRLSLSSDK